MCSYINIKVLCETCNFMLQSPSHWGEGAPVGGVGSEQFRLQDFK